MTLFAYLAPLMLALAGFIALRAHGPRPANALMWSRVGSLGAVAVTVLLAVSVAAYGTQTGPLIGAAGLGLQVQLDALSVIMALLVAGVGAVVVQFSRNYLDGDHGQGRFLGWMCITIAAVLFVVLAGNMVQLAIGWIAMSLSLHQLLVFYPERAAAQKAANAKARIARIGDVLVIGSMALLYMTFGTGEIAAILDGARALDNAPTPVLIAALMIVAAGLLKSAQMPMHGWLTRVMETPTPVSALLHAGVINAGGFLVIRFADVVLINPGAMVLLIIVGGISAAVGSLVMLTQSTAKGALAWSTIAQMGFMLLQCGFGVFSAALLHIVAHSLYKAYAFLSAGGRVGEVRSTPLNVSGIKAAGALAGAFAMVLITGWAMGVTVDTKPALVVLGAIVVMGLAHMLMQATAASMPRVIASTFAVSVLYFVLQLGVEAMTASILPPMQLPDPIIGALMIATVVVFGIIALIQIVGPARSQNAAWQKLWARLAATPS